MSATVYTELLPPLTEKEYESLKTDIAERGCLVPVEIDEQGQVLDGANRLRACEELGIDTPMVTRTGLSEADKRAHAIALNLRRRQLSREQRADLHRQLRAAGKSLREIAKASGVHHKTVQNDVSGGEKAPPERTTGRDGKSYPAKTGKKQAKQFHSENGELSKRQRELAEGAKSRIQKAVGNCSALARAADELRIELAAVVTDPEELEGWIEVFGEAKGALSRLQKRIQEVSL